MSTGEICHPLIYKINARACVWNSWRQEIRAHRLKLGGGGRTASLVIPPVQETTTFGHGMPCRTPVRRLRWNLLAVCFLSLAGIISPQWRRVWWGKPAHVSTKGASRAIRGGGGEQGGGRGSKHARRRGGIARREGSVELAGGGGRIAVGIESIAKRLVCWTRIFTSFFKFT